MIALYKESATFRMVLRVIVLGVLTWIVQLGADVPIDASTIRALIVALAYGLLGLTTPLEPFVGIGRPKNVEVPSPPAVLE